MLAAPAPFFPAPEPLSPPTPRERQLTWGAVFLSLAVFWCGVGFAVNALWSSYVA
jgi:hypothetical protein